MTATDIKKYAIVGLGGRSRFYYQALVGKYKDTSKLVGFCDVNQTRMDYANKVIAEKFGHPPVKTYYAWQFEQMIEETKPDIVIVTSIDRTHDRYIIAAMNLGCDVITEKPMTIDEVRCQNILDTVKATGRELRVTFNYRYAPYNTKIRELIMDDVIGDVNSVHFEWLLNTTHGADYFRRWHRDKRNSGGLLVHKATHHFDLVNFWLGTRPTTVFAMGDLMFYGRENAEKRGITRFYYRAYGSENAKDDPFALHLDRNEQLTELYLKAESEDGYLRDQSVFGDGISIEDTMAVMVRYENRAMMTYSLNAYLPWEGYRVAFNGTKGRIEVEVRESAYVNAGDDASIEGAVKSKSITVFPMFGRPYVVPVEEAKGGHGGGDPRLLEDLFGTKQPDRFKRAASHIDGALSILTGIAANKSIQTGMPVRIDDLVKF
ncbi:MAG: Gfo/Idh/MocA family oxidoreductase [Bacillota bacterium]|jgi:predicted dehydrogenase|nr:Gfo/Idh/MocA family oxidoreductase [Bacillota bacterium]HPZ54350.1 Gfo/Idh/MocA family oxidoreductase [Bacillota bacterium]HQD17633.1 Gfo/Idh/MocA family oxidoreductase [Bacillota bacterium]